MAICLFIAAALASPSPAAELKPQTTTAFDHYVHVAEARMAAQLAPAGAFLFLDSLPEAKRAAAYQRLRHSEIIIQKLPASEHGKELSVPSALVHHWVGVVFVPGASMQQTLAVAQDYDNRALIYRPEVIASRLLSRNKQDDSFHVFLRLYSHHVTTVILNTEYEIHYRTLSPTRVVCTSYSTRIGEVADTSKPDGPELPPGQEHGYLWRLYTYWRFQEKDGGVYIQCEAISLTRGIPFGFGWLFGPLVKSIPREALTHILGQTRSAITSHLQRPAR